ncbi:MAG: DUF4263 domain-containing protein [Thermodesulfobacteriota bacterium]|nr:DUF4263 domain-containing protein [Thermodesulfobacteriota bacterium]
MSSKRSFQTRSVPLSHIPWDSVIREYRNLIDADLGKDDIRKFIEEHCYLLLQGRNHKWHDLVVARPSLGDSLPPDFVMFGLCCASWLTFVRLERPSDSVFNTRSDLSTRFSHALNQISYWREWISDNREYFHSEYSFHHFVQFEIVIGRGQDLNLHAERLKGIGNDVTVSSFDSLIQERFMKNDDPYFQNRIMQKAALSWHEYKSIVNRDATYPLDLSFWCMGEEGENSDIPQ